jgi:hypothetical protein
MIDIKCYGTGCPLRMRCIRYTFDGVRPLYNFIPYTQLSGCFRFIDNGVAPVISEIREKSEQEYEKLPEEVKNPPKPKAKRKRKPTKK